MKSNILVLTITDDDLILANQIKMFFASNVPTHEVIIIGGEKFVKVNKDGFVASSRKVKLYLKNSLALSPSKRKAPKLYSSSTKCLHNAVLRFQPESVIAFSPFALRLLIDTKKKFTEKFTIVSIGSSFIVDKYCIDQYINSYIVENNDMKEKLIQNGVSGRNIVVMGMPFAVQKNSSEQLKNLKQELGFGKRPTVFVYSACTAEVVQAVRLLVEQGDIINIVVYAKGNTSFLSKLRKIIDQNNANNVSIITTDENLDDYIAASDIIITNLSSIVLYKGLGHTIPIITFSPKDTVSRLNMQYLGAKKLAYFAKDNNDVIVGLYEILQTDFKNTLISNANERNRDESLEMICGYISALGLMG